MNAVTYEAIVPYDGEFHAVSELTGITQTENNTYTVQLAGCCLFKEGTGGNGAYESKGIKEFQFLYKGEDLYIKAAKITDRVKIVIS